MNRHFRIRRFNNKTKTYDTLFPQTVTENVLRRDNGGVLERYLHQYDEHLRFAPPHLNRAISFGTHRHLIAFIPNKKLVDGFPLLLTLHTELDFEPTLDFNKSGPKPIINGAGERIPGGQVPGVALFMTYSEKRDAWILLSNDNYSDVTRMMAPVQHNYYYEAVSSGETVIIIPEFDRHTMHLQEVNYGQTVLAYKLGYDFAYDRNDAIQLKGFHLEKGDILYFKWTSYITTARKGHAKYDIANTPYYFEIKESGQTMIVLPDGLEEMLCMDVIYGQTKLREGMDFTRDVGANTITFAFPLEIGDIITVNVSYLHESLGELLPNNWGTKGTYRYSVDVLHGEFTADEDHVRIFPVPKYDHRRDEITVILDNKVLVYDVDYSIDLLDQVVLLTQELNTDDTIHYTILKGALIDVPNFNVIQASGVSGQHILVDITHNTICDYFVLLIKLRNDLETAPTIKCIDGPALPIADCFGNPVLGGYKAGSFLWVVFNEEQQTWYSLGHGQMDLTSRFPLLKTDQGIANFLGDTLKDNAAGDDHLNEIVIPHNLGVKPTSVDVIPIEPPNIDPVTGEMATIGDIWCYADEENIYIGNTGNATSKFQWTVSTQGPTVDLTAYMEIELAKLRERAGNIYTKLQAVTIEKDNTTNVSVDWFDGTRDKLLVNYGQTILREDIDWVRTTAGIRLTQFALMKDDIIQFTIIRQDSTEREDYKLT